MNSTIIEFPINNTQVCVADFPIYSNYLHNFPFFFINIIKILSSLFFASFLAVVYVSHCLHNPCVKKFEKLYTENKENYEYDKFLVEYLDEYYELEETKDHEFLKTLYVKYINYTFDFRDKTYRIIMNYDSEDETFNYYLNEKSHVLPFDFLDTIARIYSVKYNCKNIYIDNYDNNEKYINTKNNTDDTDNDSKENKNNIFYSKSNKKIKVKSVDDYVSNKFKYNGLIKDFTESIIGFDLYNIDGNIISFDNIENEIFSIKKKDDFELISRDENISFKDFKNSLKS